MEITGIEKLLQIKKKSNASKSKRIEFMNEWLSYVNEYGFNDSAEAYLYDGFSFLGMVPFSTYLSKINDKQELISKLLSGKRLYKNKSVSFKVILHLLALLIEEFPDEKTLIMPVIRRLPELSINKDGKYLGDLAKSVDKYFVKVITPKTILPNLYSLELRPAIIDSFCNMMKEALHILMTEGHISSDDMQILANIDKWLSNNGKISADINNTEMSKETSHKLTDVDPEVKSDTTDTFENVDNTLLYNCNKYTWRDGISITVNAIRQIEKELIRLQLNNENLMSENTKLKDARASLQRALDSEHEISEQLKAKISHLSEENNILRLQIEDLEFKIKEKDIEIKERTKLTEMLSRDRSRQSEEVLRRLAAQLRVEYRDFLDAESLPMNIDLGENMRLQMKSIFNILIKNGLSLE